MEVTDAEVGAAIAAFDVDEGEMRELLDDVIKVGKDEDLVVGGELRVVGVVGCLGAGVDDGRGEVWRLRLNGW